VVNSIGTDLRRRLLRHAGKSAQCGAPGAVSFPFRQSVKMRGHGEQARQGGGKLGISWTNELVALLSNLHAERSLAS
jgi:hypothetical protein